jgi:hypothetical protein
MAYNGHGPGLHASYFWTHMHSTGAAAQTPRPLLRARPTLSQGEGMLLLRLLAGEDLVDIVEADRIAYIMVYKRALITALATFGHSA